MHADLATFQPLLLALSLGLLVGLQRERDRHRLGGIRTFPLIALLGAMCAMLARPFGGWVLAAGFLTLGLVILVSQFSKDPEPDKGPGITTEVAALAVFALGAMLVAGYTAPAIALGGLITVLLHWKRPLHRFARNVGEGDFRAITQFVLIALVILPVLPDQTYGPYDVLNPFRIWLLVALIVTISLAGYLVHRLIGERRGALLAGLLGGVVSSTATTISFARQARRSPSMLPDVALIFMLASTVVYPRIAVEIGAVAPGLLWPATPPLLVVMAVMAASAALLYRGSAQSPETPSLELDNPAQPRAALFFGALYTVLLLAVAAFKDRFGTAGIYVVSTVSGLTQVDALTLSAAHLVQDGSLQHAVAWRAILLATLANLVFKFGVAGLLGGGRLLRRLVPAVGLSLFTGVLVLTLWPD